MIHLMEAKFGSKLAAKLLGYCRFVRDEGTRDEWLMLWIAALSYLPEMQQYVCALNTDASPRTLTEPGSVCPYAGPDRRLRHPESIVRPLVRPSIRAFRVARHVKEVVRFPAWRAIGGDERLPELV